MQAHASSNGKVFSEHALSYVNLRCHMFKDLQTDLCIMAD